MKIIYIEQDLIEELNNQINLKEYLQNNKLVIISRNPYLMEKHFYFKKYLPLVDNNSIMYMALGNLAAIINSEVEYLNYGPGFTSSELIYFPIKYYQDIKDEKIDEISFCYRNNNLSDINNLYDEMESLSLNSDMTKLVDFKNINIEKTDNTRYLDKNKTKIIFISSDHIFYGMHSNIDAIRECSKEYLERGNILTLLTYIGNHFGYPFAVNKNCVSDTDSHNMEYMRLINYFESLEILRDQVANFKLSYTGLNYLQKSYNFGFGFDNINKFFGIYLDYLRKVGYNIDDIYLFDKERYTYANNSFRSTNIDYNFSIVNNSKDYVKELKKILR